MEKALHIASGQMISAYKAEYKDYYGIFICPSCKEVVHLRKRYTRSDGVIVSAAFVHPEAQQTDSCPLRVDILTTGSIAATSDSISRGQDFELLQTYFIVILNTLIDTYPRSLFSFRDERVYKYVQVVKVADIRKTDVIKFYYFKDELKNKKGFLRKTYQDSFSNLKKQLTFWTPLEVERFLTVAAKILTLPQSSWEQISKNVNLQYFIDNKEIWKGLSHRTKLTNISIDCLTESHYYRVLLVQDFLRLSAKDLTRQLTVCVAIEKALSQLSIRRWLWLETECTISFLKAAETALTTPQIIDDLCQAIQKGKIPPRFENLAFFVQLILQLVEELIMYIDWGFTLKSIIENNAN